MKINKDFLPTDPQTDYIIKCGWINNNTVYYRLHKDFLIDIYIPLHQNTGIVTDTLDRNQYYKGADKYNGTNLRLPWIITSWNTTDCVVNWSGSASSGVFPYEFVMVEDTNNSGYSLLKTAFRSYAKVASNGYCGCSYFMSGYISKNSHMFSTPEWQDL